MIYLGKVTNTHGLKGEMRIISDFTYKDLIFKPGNLLYLDQEKHVILSYRPHKQYDMVILDQIDSIEKASVYKNVPVYFERKSLPDSVLVFEDYFGCEVYSTRYLGKVVDLWKNKAHEILVIEREKKRYLVPNVPAFVKKVDREQKRIEIEEIGGMFDDD